MKKKNLFFNLLIVITFILGVIACEQELPNNIDNTNTLAILDEQFRDYEIIEVNNVELRNAIKSKTGEETVNLDFRHFSSDPLLSKLSAKMKTEQFLADDFTAQLIDENDQLTPIELPEVHYFKGQIDGQDSKISMAIEEDYFNAIIYDGETAYSIEPLVDYIPDAKPNQYIRYNEADVIDNEAHTSCNVPNPENIEQIISADNSNSEDLETRAPKCRKVEVMVIGDLSLTNKFGGNRNKASQWMRQRIWRADDYYKERNNYPVDFILSNLYLRTYNVSTTSNPSNFLPAWRNYCQSRGWIKKRDVNVIFTGINSTKYGYAYIKTVCSNRTYSYGYVRYFSNNAKSVTTTAHEIGHMLGAYHSGGGFMKAAHNSTSFMHGATRAQLNNHLNNNNGCLGYWNCN